MVGRGAKTSREEGEGRSASDSSQILFEGAPCWSTGTIQVNTAVCVMKYFLEGRSRLAEKKRSEGSHGNWGVAHCTRNPQEGPRENP